MQSKDQTKAYGQLDVDGLVSANRVNINYIENPPILPGDLVVKSYVDNLIATTSFTSGTGINLTGVSLNVINVNPNQPTIVQLGTINTGTWAASTIAVSYGGTGRVSIPSSTLLAGNGVNPITSLSNLVYINDHLYSETPIIVNNTQNTSTITPTSGGLYLAGGGYVKKDWIIEGTVSSGSIYSNYGTIENSRFTTISMGNIYVTGISSIGNLTCTNITTGGIIAGDITNVNTSSGSLYSTNNQTINFTTNNAIVTGATIGDIRNTNITSSNLYTTNGILTNTTVTDAIITNTTTSTLRFVSASGTNMTSLNINCTNNTSTTLSTLTSNSFVSRITHGSLVNVTASTLTCTFNTLGSVLISNGNFLNTTTNNALITSNTTVSLVTMNHLGTNNTLTNLIMSNQTVNNSIVTNQEITNHTVTNAVVTGQTTINLISTNITTTTLNCVGASIGTLDSVTVRINQGTIGNILGTDATINNISLTNVIGTNLTMSNNVIINQTAGSITTTNLTSVNSTITNTLVSNETCTNLDVTEQTCGNLHLINQTCSNINVINGTIGNINSTFGNIYRCNTTFGNIVNGTIGTLDSTRITVGNLVLLESSILGFTPTGSSLIHGETAGSLVTLFPVNLTDSVATGTIDAWSTCVFNQSTLTGTNSISTLKASTIHITTGPVEGVNNSIVQAGGLSIGYVANSTGSALNGQILFGREDGEWYSGIYTEDNTNKTVLANASVSGGGGLGLYSANGPVTLSSFPNANDVTPTTFIEFSKNSSSYYSTVDASNGSTGSLVTNGGIYVNKTLRSEKQAIGYTLLPVTEGQSIVMSSTSGNIALSSATTITNLNITLPASGTMMDGMTLIFFTNTLISNITFGNAFVTMGTLDATTSKKFVNVSSNTLWWNI